MGLFHAFQPADGRDFQRFQLAAGHQVIGRADGRFHHAAGAAEEFAGRGPLAEGSIGLFGRQFAQVQAPHADQLASSRVVSTASMSGSPSWRHFRAVGLELLRRAGHDAHAVDLGRIDAPRSAKQRLITAPIICCGLLQVERFSMKSGIEGLDELDPARRATGDHRQPAAVFQAMHQFRGLFHDRQVGGEAGIEDPLEAQAAEHAGHGPGHVGARRACRTPRPG